jgi:hypothetical protein
MGFNETKCNNIEIKNKSAILNGRRENKTRYQVKNKINSLL